MNAFRALLQRPRFAGSAHLVARRNADVYFLAWKTDFFPPLLEPILFLGAIGYGIGAFIPEINGLTYQQFLAPALIMLTTVNAAFFECSYGSFVRMYYQKTYDAIISTPINLDDVILGELLWAAAKSVINAFIVLLVITAFGLAQWPHALLVFPAVILCGLIFGAIGILTTSQAPNFDAFNYPMYLYVIPMQFLSGTFFPLEEMPQPLQTAAYTFPLTHATLIARGVTHAHYSIELIYSLIWLTIVALILCWMSINAMRQRLIK